jgi:tetratricopeptide (TPR) repeat protein
MRSVPIESHLAGGSTLFVSPLRVALLVAILVVVIVNGSQGQTSQPATQPTELSHGEALKQAAGPPLRVVKLKNPEGNLLSAEAAEKIAQANKLLSEADELRTKHDYAAAAQKAKDAMTLRREALGNRHILSVSATGISRLMSAFSTAPPEEQQRLGEGEDARRQAEKAWDAGDYAQTVEFAGKAVELREKVMGNKNPEMIDIEALRLLGAAQTELGRLEDADKSLMRCLVAIESTYGKMHPQAARVLERLGWLRAGQGKLEEAIDSLRRSIRLISDADGESAEAARVLDTLGTVLAFNNDYQEAWSLKLRALVIRQKLLGERAPDTAEGMSNLAWLYSRLGRLEDAIKLRETALSIFDEKLGPDHAYSKIEFINLESDYERAGRFSDATKLVQGLLDGKRGKLTKASELSSWTARLGFVYLAEGRWADGRASLTSAMKHAGDLHASGQVQPAVASAFQIAGSFFQHRMYDDALKAHEQIRTWTKDDKEPPSDAVLNARTQLAEIYLEQGRAGEAATMLKEILAEFSKRYGEDELQTAQPLCDLARACERLDKIDEAESLWQRVVKIGEAKFPAGDIHAAYGMRGLGRVYSALKKFDQAGFIFSEARTIVDKNEEFDPGEAVRLRLDLATYHLAAGEKVKVEPLLREAVDRSRKFSEKVKSLPADSLHAEALEKMADAIASGAMTGDANAIRSELKAVLEKLASAQALNADQKSRLAKLTGSASGG